MATNVMMKFNGFKFDGPRIEDHDLPRIGREVGVGEDIIHGVMDTEAGGKSTDSKGRIKMLYEPHIAYRESKGTIRDKLVAAGLAYPKWKKGYPADSYPRLLKAAAIDETVALLACSWGFPQILGSNYVLAGYDSIQDMVLDMLADEDNQLEAMIRFIKGAHLDDELRVLEKTLKAGNRITPDDARPFVRGYNGPAYEKNGYHTTFAKNVNKWAKIPDYVERPEQPKQPAAKPPKADMPEGFPVAYKDGKVYEELRAVQTLLDAKGYPEVGTIDGKWGTRTASAVFAVKTDNKLMPANGDLDAGFLAALPFLPARKIDTARTDTTVADLRAEGAEEIKDADQQQIAGGVAAAAPVAVAGVTLLEKAEGYSGYLDRALKTVEPYKDFLIDNAIYILIAVGAFVAYKAYKQKQIRVEKHRLGQDVSR